MQANVQGPHLIQLAPLFAAVATAIGATASTSILSGDDYGRVNLLFSLLLFALLPALSFLTTLVLLLLGRSSGVASLLIKLRIIPMRFYPTLTSTLEQKRQRASLFYLSQLIILAFAVGTLLGFILLLLTSDVSFVWRSTLLDAAALLPSLELLSTPWSFWQEALPSLSMLSETQDFRLADTPEQGAYLGHWWRFLLAAQLSYSLIPRVLLLCFARQRLRQLSASEANAKQSLNLDPAVTASMHQADQFADSVTNIAPGAILIDWAHTPTTLLDSIGRRLSVSATYPRPSTPTLALFRDSLDGKNQPIVFLVRSWEPPLGELADFIADEADVYLAPIDWLDNELTPPRKTHVLEWRRFCATKKHCLPLSLVEASE